MIQNLILVILFLKILFRAYSFSPHVPVDIIRVFLFQKISKPIKTCEKDHSSYNAVSLKKLHSFLGISPLLQTCFCLVSEKNICTAPFVDTKELLS